MSDMYPQAPRTQLLVTVLVDPDTNTIRTVLPEKSEHFKSLVRSLGYSWDWDWRMYVRTIDMLSGSLQDRSVQLVQTLLRANYPVRISDSLAQLITTHTYQPECMRWIIALVDGAYAGRPALLCKDRQEKERMYEKGRRLGGTRYASGMLVLRSESYEAILDFAQQHEFQITPAAQSLLGAARTHRAKALIVDVSALPRLPQIPKQESPLNVPVQVVIPDHLRDDL